MVEKHVPILMDQMEVTYQSSTCLVSRYEDSQGTLVRAEHTVFPGITLCYKEFCRADSSLILQSPGPNILVVEHCLEVLLFLTGMELPEYDSPKRKLSKHQVLVAQNAHRYLAAHMSEHIMVAFLSLEIVLLPKSMKNPRFQTGDLAVFVWCSSACTSISSRAFYSG